jgi:hypothetical protein
VLRNDHAGRQAEAPGGGGLWELSGHRRSRTGTGAAQRARGPTTPGAARRSRQTPGTVQRDAAPRGRAVGAERAPAQPDEAGAAQPPHPARHQLRHRPQALVPRSEITAPLAADTDHSPAKCPGAAQRSGRTSGRSPRRGRAAGAERAPAQPDGTSAAQRARAPTTPDAARRSGQTPGTVQRDADPRGRAVGAERASAQPDGDRRRATTPLGTNSGTAHTPWLRAAEKAGAPAQLKTAALRNHHAERRAEAPGGGGRWELSAHRHGRTRNGAA